MEEAKTLSSDQAQSIVSTIRAVLGINSFSASIAVVTRDGRLLSLLSMDNARPFTADVALAKAKQAASTGRRTRETAKQVENGEVTPEILGFDPRRFVRWAGGVPVYHKDGTLLGGVGVSNLAPDQDEAFATVGVEDRGFVLNRE